MRVLHSDNNRRDFCVGLATSGTRKIAVERPDWKLGRITHQTSGGPAPRKKPQLIAAAFRKIVVVVDRWVDLLSAG